MKTIWKYEISPADQVISMPSGADPLCVQLQGEVPQLWMLVNPSAPKESRVIRVFGTGHDVPNRPGLYVGTFQMHGGSLVWHVFIE